MTDLTVYKEEVIAPSIYNTNINLEEDIFADADEVKELKQAGALDQSEYAADSEGGGYDNSWRYHRVLKWGDSDIMNWKMNITKEQEEQGFSPIELNPNNPKHAVVAVRGIPLEFGWTPRWTKKTEDNKYYGFCQGTKLVETFAGQTRVTEDSHPVKMPIKMMHQSKAKPNAPNYFWQNNPHLSLFAKRYASGSLNTKLNCEVEDLTDGQISELKGLLAELSFYPKDKEKAYTASIDDALITALYSFQEANNLPAANLVDAALVTALQTANKEFKGRIYQKDRSCLDCIKCGEHFEGDDIGADNVQRCRPDGQLLFVVFEVGIKNVTAHNEDPISNPITIDWVPVSEAGINSYTGQSLNQPFVIRVQGLGSSQLSSIGTKDFDLPVILPSQIKANRPKDCFLPDDNVLSTLDYYNYLNNKNATDGRRGVEKGTGKSLYPVMTEIYMAKLAKKTATKDYIPVFRPLLTGARTEYNGIKLGTYVATAKAVLVHEASSFDGDSGSSAPAFTPGAAPIAALPSAVSVETKPVESDVPANAVTATETLTPKAFRTFTPPTA